MHKLTQKPSEHLASATNQAVFVWHLKAFEIAQSKLFSWAVTQMDLGKRGAQSPCSENRNLGGLPHPEVGTQAAQAVGKRCTAGQGTLNHCEQPCSCADKMLAPAIYLQGLFILPSAVSICGCSFTALVPALEGLSGSSIWDGTSGCWRAHTECRARMSHTELTASTRLSQTIWFCCPFIKCKLKKLWNSRQ